MTEVFLRLLLRQRVSLDGFHAARTRSLQDSAYRGLKVKPISAMGRMFLTLMAECAELERNLVAQSHRLRTGPQETARPAAIGSDSMPNSGATR